MAPAQTSSDEPRWGHAKRARVQLTRSAWLLMCVMLVGSAVRGVSAQDTAAPDTTSRATVYPPPAASPATSSAATAPDAANATSAAPTGPTVPETICQGRRIARLEISGQGRVSA